MNHWLTVQAQCFTVNGITSGWLPVSSGALQGSILESALKVYIICLNTGLKGILIKLKDITELIRTVDSLDDREVLQKDVDKLKE